MFETKEEITAKVQALFDHSRRLGRGDILTHSVLAVVFGLEPYEGRWNHLVTRFRKKIERERHITLMSVAGVGYKLCTVDEQIAQGPYRFRRANRQLTRGVRSVRVLDDADGMNMAQKQCRALMLVSMKAGKRELRQQARISAALMQPTPTHPINPKFARSAADAPSASA